HEIPAVRAARGRRYEHFDVIDLGVAPGVHSLAHAPSEIGQRLDVLQIYAQLVALDQEEPIAAPGDVAAHFTDARHLHDDLLVLAEAHDVGDRNLAVCVQHRVHRADRRIDLYQPGLHLSGERERRHKADRAVAAHAEVADVVEEDDTEAAIAAVGRTQQRTDDDIGPARLVDDCGTVVVELLTEARETVAERPAAQVWSAIQHQPGWLPAGVRVDDAHNAHMHIQMHDPPPCRLHSRSSVAGAL